MALPYEAPRFELTVDDVASAEHMQRLADRFNDARAHFGVAHYVVGQNGMLGGSSNGDVPIAVALMPPSGDPVFSVGFATGYAPRWENGLITFKTVTPFYGGAVTCGFDYGAGPMATADIAQDSSDPRHGWVGGAFGSGNWLTHVLLVIYGETL